MPWLCLARRPNHAHICTHTSYDTPLFQSACICMKLAGIKENWWRNPDNKTIIESARGRRCLRKWEYVLWFAGVGGEAHGQQQFVLQGNESSKCIFRLHSECHIERERLENQSIYSSLRFFFNNSIPVRLFSIAIDDDETGALESHPSSLETSFLCQKQKLRPLAMQKLKRAQRRKCLSVQFGLLANSLRNCCYESHLIKNSRVVRTIR